MTKRIKWVSGLTFWFMGCLAQLLLVTTAHGSACTCQDTGAMLMRINEAGAAIRGLQIEETQYTQVSAEKGKDYMYSKDAYKDMRDAVQAVINAAVIYSKPESTFGSAETNSVTCDVTIKDKPSPCIEESLRRHEAVHVEICNAKEKGLRAEYHFFTDYHDGVKMADVAEEEILGYTVEIDGLNKVLASQKCPNPCDRAGLPLPDEKVTEGALASNTKECKQPERDYTSQKRGRDPGVKRPHHRWDIIS